MTVVAQHSAQRWEGKCTQFKTLSGNFQILSFWEHKLLVIQKPNTTLFVFQISQLH